MSTDHEDSPSSDEVDDLDIDYSQDDPADLIGAVDFDGLSPTDFEDFCFDLMSAVGFQNVDWRKGTPTPSSPADQGRDIVAEHAHADVDGFGYTQRWFVDCKHYTSKGVPPDALTSTMAWAESERPDVVLFVLSGFLTNGAKNWLQNYESNNNPRFRIRYWELPQLRNLLANHQDVAFKHNVGLSTLRRVSDILEKESELTDRLWYGRKPPLSSPWWDDKGVDKELMARSLKAVEDRVGKEILDRDVSNDFYWAHLLGEASALRWVLGDDLGNGDS
ncbi:restriction endonuclease [Williamsia sp. R60]